MNSGLATLNGFFTYGNTNNNITAAAGWGWADGEFRLETDFINKRYDKGFKELLSLAKTGYSR